jgi:hypothetical protein
MVTDGTLLKVYAWYDNEMGYACRMVDLACHLQRARASEVGRRAMNAGTRNYAIVTAAYWGFTLSDGALRMLVLLHFYRLGYSPFTLAFLFLLYEAGRGGQPDRRLAGHALRHRPHAGGGPGHADHRLPAAVGAVAGVDGGHVGGLGGGGAGHLRRGQGPDQDRQQVGHQAHRQATARGSCSSGWPSSPAARTR